MIHQKAMKRIEGHQGKTHRLAFTPDGRFIMSGGSDGTLKLWDSFSGECIKTLEGHSDEVTGVVIVPSGSLALSGSLDGTLRLWDIQEGKIIRVFYDEEDKITCVILTPDGRAALSGSEAGYLRLWDLASGQCLQVFDRHPACRDMRDIMSLIRTSNREFSYNDAIGNCAVAQTFDAETHTFFGHAAALTALDVSPCGRYVISGSCDSTVRLWDMGSGKCLWIFGGHDGGSGFWIHDVAVSSNGRRVLALTNKIQVWRLSSKTIRRYLWGILREKLLFVINDQSVSGSCMAITADGRSIFVTTDRDKTVSLFQLRTRERRRVFDLENQVAISIAVSQDGAILAVGTDDGIIVLFNLH